MTQTSQPHHVIEGQLVAAAALLGNLTTVFGPTCAFTASELPGGGWIIFSDGKPWAACTEAWQVPEIMGQVMAEHFTKSFTRPEHARNVTPTLQRAADVADEPMPDGGVRVLRQPEPVQPPRMQHAPSAPNGAERVRATAMLALTVLAMGVRGVWGA